MRRASGSPPAKEAAALASRPGTAGLSAGSSAAALVPRKADGAAVSLSALKHAARGCTACDLYKNATQTVFGEGQEGARLLLVGEQPGDSEDLAGRPFVGPAGGLLDKALESVGVPRAEAYVTNAVKHFSFVVRGKRRIHQKPKAGEIKACRGWLAAELEVIAPEVVVCLGATAAQALLGPQFKITKERGRAIATPYAEALIATYHPSAILRAPDAEARRAMWDALVSDLGLAWEIVQGRLGAAGAHPSPAR